MHKFFARGAILPDVSLGEREKVVTHVAHVAEKAMDFAEKIRKILLLACEEIPKSVGHEHDNISRSWRVTSFEVMLPSGVKLEGISSNGKSLLIRLGGKGLDETEDPRGFRLESLPEETLARLAGFLEREVTPLIEKAVAAEVATAEAERLRKEADAAIKLATQVQARLPGLTW